ncbi:MAG: hypothetical protein ACI9QL_005272 [Candidatus Omnitrophota bacterium]|jgi:hypothetical protein
MRANKRGRFFIGAIVAWMGRPRDHPCGRVTGQSFRRRVDLATSRCVIKRWPHFNSLLAHQPGKDEWSRGRVDPVVALNKQKLPE